MTMTTFEEDGYAAGKSGGEASPPDSYTRYDGQTTNVYAIEYMRGYEAGNKDRDNNR
jgi:hypothetical protein